MPLSVNKSLYQALKTSPIVLEAATEQAEVIFLKMHEGVNMLGVLVLAVI